MEDRLTLDETWEVAKAYYADAAFTNDAINSYDKFISDIGKIEIPHIVVPCDDPNSPHKDTKHVIQFLRPYFGKPSINEDDPNKKATFVSKPTIREKYENITILNSDESKQRNLTYSLPIYFDISHEIFRKNQSGEYQFFTRKFNDKAWLGDLPLIVGSEWDTSDLFQHKKLPKCPYDIKGYFQVNGNEKIVIPQTRMRYNYIIVTRKTNNKPMLQAEVRSLSENDFTDATVVILKFKIFGGRGEETFKLKFPYINYDINLVTVFRALGVESDKEICELIMQGRNDPKMMECLSHTITEGMTITSQSEALTHISKKAQSFIDAQDVNAIKSYAINILNRDLFPHIGKTEKDFRSKAWYLGYMAHKILLVHFGHSLPDNRDHYANKRVDLVGPLLREVFCQLIDTIRRDIAVILGKWLKDGKPIPEISTLFKRKPITQRLRYIIATGNWTVNTNKKTNRTGVTAVLQRLSYQSALSHAHRLNTPIGREGKLSKPRQLDNSQWGVIDPSETPEGANIGLVNNFSLFAHVTMGDTSYHMMDIIMSMDIIPLDKCTTENLTMIRVFVNGRWVGMTKDGWKMERQLRQLKRCGAINYESGIVFKTLERSVFVNTDAGRIVHPLLVVKDGKPVITREKIEELKHGKNSQESFAALIVQGMVEMVDVEEQDNMLIAIFPKDLEKANEARQRGDLKHAYQYTHLEIHPVSIFGHITGCIPYLNHNPSPRTTFQGAMGKQVISVPSTDFDRRMDTVMHVLNYPQKPITTTKVMKLTRADELGPGFEAVVAIACLDGYNVDDAIIISEKAIDLGMARSTMYRTFKESEQKHGNHYSEEFKKPSREKCHGMKPGSIEKLEEDGIVAVGSTISPDDYIVGKTTPFVSSDPKFTEKDHSLICKSTERGIIDRVVITTNEDGFKKVEARMRTERKPVLGDKFSSRHGQKGVIGKICPYEDLPFTKDGITPDIIINPHCKPSRMTIAMILEMLSGKIGCLTGMEIDATAFEDCDEDEETTQQKLQTMLEKLGYPKTGEEVFINGTTGEMFRTPIFIGTCYYQRLKHMVDDKIHARAKGPVNILTKQPIDGRPRDGGLRFGEMERDCTIAHGVALLLQDRTMGLSDECTTYFCKKCGFAAWKNWRRNTYHCSKCIHNAEIRRLTVPYAKLLLINEMIAMGIKPKMIIQDKEIEMDNDVFLDSEKI